MTHGKIAIGSDTVFGFSKSVECTNVDTVCEDTSHKFNEDYVLYNRSAIQDPLPLPKYTSPKEYGISLIGRRSKKRHK